MTTFLLPLLLLSLLFSLYQQAITRQLQTLNIFEYSQLAQVQRYYRGSKTIQQDSSVGQSQVTTFQQQQQFQTTQQSSGLQPKGGILNVNQTSNNSILLNASSQTSQLIVHTLLESNKTLNTKFTGMILYHSVPLTFTQNQLFVIKGKLLQPAQTAGIFVNLILRQRTTGQRYSFNKYIINGNIQFTLNLDFSTTAPGVYYFTLFPGTMGTTQTQLYTILPFSAQQKTILPQNYAKPLPANNFLMQVVNNQLIFSWQKNIQIPVNKLLFSQTQTQSIIKNQSAANTSLASDLVVINKTYYLSNYQNRFSVPFADFVNFNFQNITVELFQAYSMSESLTNRSSNYSDSVSLEFMPAIHQFSQSDKTSIQLADLPWKIKVGDQLLINGTALSQLQNQIIIEQPTKSFEVYYFDPNSSSPYISSGYNLNHILKFQSQGTFILEINNAGGSAVINRPVYVGERYPILPDFIDLASNTNPQTVINGQITDVTQQRIILLDLINKKRTQFGSTPLYQDTILNTLAQSYTDDMVKRNFYGHINPEGQGPQQRAAAAGIQSMIGQNLAININFTEAHYRLCRSPAHLKNLVDPSWTRVGLGLQRNNQSYFYIAQQFSIRDLKLYPLTTGQLTGFQNEVMNYILSINKTIISQNKKLSTLISEWQSFNSTQQSATTLGKYILSNGFNRYSLGNIMVYYTSSFMNSIVGTNYLTPQGTGYTQVGVGVFYKNGFLEIFVSYI